MAAPRQHPRAVFQDDRGGERPVPPYRKHVEREVRVGRIRLLADSRRLERHNRIALLARGFKVHPLARLEHLAFPLFQQVIALAFQHKAGLVDLDAVLLGRYEARARGVTAAYMVVEARPRRARQRQLELAFADMEKSGGQVRELRDDARVHVRAVVLAIVLVDRSGQEQARELLAHREGEVRKMLVVFQENVVLGLVLADEVRL